MKGQNTDGEEILHISDSNLGYMKNSQNFNNKETIYEIKGKILNKIHQRK